MKDITIKLHKEVRDDLNKLKACKNDSYNDIIERLICFYHVNAKPMTKEDMKKYDNYY